MIGIDVGGANLKVVNEQGVHIHYCPLWEGTPVTDFLKNYCRTGETRAAVVMSGELADCFSSKKEGIAFIVNAVRAAFPDALFYGTDARFHPEPVPALAAANWLASADYLREKYPCAVLADVGSTTTDVIPLPAFDTLKGLTDLARLRRGYLIYTGILRTSIPTLVRSVRLGGTETPVSTEYFAVSADAHLVLGHITPAMYTCDAPDRKAKSVAASLRRLARVVCADLDEIGEGGAVQIAQEFWNMQKGIISRGVERVVEEVKAEEIIVAGTGAPLFARELGGIDLTKELGSAADALPAFAVREVALRSGCL
jgi:probable H4MPT-linked C1 transfer pathway protein